MDIFNLLGIYDVCVSEYGHIHTTQECMEVFGSSLFLLGKTGRSLVSTVLHSPG